MAFPLPVPPPVVFGRRFFLQRSSVRSFACLRPLGRTAVLLVAAVLVLGGCTSQAPDVRPRGAASTAAGVVALPPAPAESLLWYAEPAKVWTEALPLGNGRLGAMVFGGVGQERLQLNEDSLWSGRPEDADNPQARAVLPEIRQLLFAGRYAEAQKLADRYLICRGPGSVRGKGARGAYGSYQTLGDLWLDFGAGHVAEAGSYRRELDLDQAVARVSYRHAGVQYRREVFASYPDQVLVARLAADRRGALHVRVRLARSEAAEVRPEGRDGLLMQGQLWDGEGPRGMKFAARLRVLLSGGTMRAEGDTIVVEGADEVRLLLTAATDYALQLPHWRQGDPMAKTAAHLTAAEAYATEQLLARHRADYQPLYRRMALDLGAAATALQPTDQRLAAVKAGAFDPGLTSLYFHFGRYLLIASSRHGDMPANLQGLWADGIQNPWNADYHANINLQMIYWPAETANLPECFEPLDRYIAFLAGPGARTAQVHYGARGWTVHTLANVWGFTAPGESPSWGLSPSAGAWCAQHLWEHYAFSGDRAYLQKVFPLLRGSAEFSLDWLVEDPKTKSLVAGPATSPENKFITADGQKGSLCMAPAMEQQIIWDAFTNYLEAAQTLGIDEPLVASVRAARARLLPPQIGRDGRLMEWAEEFQEPEPGHRHISHLFALHPGRQITRAGTPELFAAARRSLEHRIAHGGAHTGWSRAWVINFWARLSDGEKAAENVRMLLAKSTLPNLFDTHPPFQIDGNFGAVAGVCEMLAQSTLVSGGEKGAPESVDLTLLPALPKSWPQGSITGLRTRGGVTLDLAWAEGRLTRVRVHAAVGGELRVRYGDQQHRWRAQPGAVRTLGPSLDVVAP